MNRYATDTWDEPNPEKRERAMGFQIGATRHPRVTRLERNALLDKVMDLNALTWLLVTCLLVQMHFPPSSRLLPTAPSSPWHPDQVHLPLDQSFRFGLHGGGGGTPM